MEGVDENHPLKIVLRPNLSAIMFSQMPEIDESRPVTEFVQADYRTSAVFEKYNIDFCCGGKISLRQACEIRSLDIDLLKKELFEITRSLQASALSEWGNWTIDFLVDYIQNIHHAYLVRALPLTGELLERFVRGHSTKYAWLPALLSLFRDLENKILPHLEQEETIFFPYIRQIAHAHASRESYAALLVRTMRKPLEEIMNDEHDYVSRFLTQCREWTNNYIVPPDACLTHKVCLLKLKELDNDLLQHIYLENDVLFPRALLMEKEMLG